MNASRNTDDILASNRRTFCTIKVGGILLTSMMLLSIVVMTAIYNRSEMARFHDVNVLAASLVSIADDPTIARSELELLRNNLVIKVLSREAVTVLEVTGLRYGLCTILETVVRDDGRLHTASINGRVQASGDDLQVDFCKRDSGIPGHGGPFSGLNEVVFHVR